MLLRAVSSLCTSISHVAVLLVPQPKRPESVLREGAGALHDAGACSSWWASSSRAPWGTAVRGTASVHRAAHPHITPRFYPEPVWVLRPHVSSWEHRAPATLLLPPPALSLRDAPWAKREHVYASASDELKRAQRCEDASCPPAAVTVHPFQSLAHVPDGLCQLLQGVVQGLLVQLQDGTDGLNDCLREERRGEERRGEERRDGAQC